MNTNKSQVYFKAPAVVSLSVNTMLGVALFVLVLALLVKRKWVTMKKKHQMYQKLETLNGPRVWPLLGTVPSMIFTDFYKWSGEMCQLWGDPLRLWRFGHPMVFISTYKYAIQLLTKSNFNGKLSDLDMIYRQPGGTGLSATPADVHPQKRKMLNPAFSRQVVEGSVEAFSKETIKLLDRLKTFAETGKSFDMVGYAMTCLFYMVARSDFGDNFIAERNDSEARQHIQALHIIAKNVTNRVVGPKLWLRNDLIYFYLTKEGRETKKAAKIINSFAERAIEKRRTYRKNEDLRKMTISDFSLKLIDESGKNHKCYLDILLDLVDSKQMTDKDVISELNNFMGGAYDTTALTVCWTLFLLALHPEHQEKVYNELNLIFGAHSSTYMITATDTKSMKYLELCLKESLRLFPPAPIFPRSTVADMKLGDGRVIPAGVDVLIFANLIHRDPSYFPNPEEFQPERHLESIPAYMPFSFGSRNCIGQVYGMYQSKVVLAYLLREYQWETLDSLEGMNISYSGLLYPANGMYFKISKRNNVCHN